MVMAHAGRPVRTALEIGAGTGHLHIDRREHWAAASVHTRERPLGRPDHGSDHGWLGDLILAGRKPCPTGRPARAGPSSSRLPELPGVKAAPAPAGKHPRPAPAAPQSALSTRHTGVREPHAVQPRCRPKSRGDHREGQTWADTFATADVGARSVPPSAAAFREQRDAPPSPVRGAEQPSYFWRGITQLG
jgi:hypothetical protein